MPRKRRAFHAPIKLISEPRRKRSKQGKRSGAQGDCPHPDPHLNKWHASIFVGAPPLPRPRSRALARWSTRPRHASPSGVSLIVEPDVLTGVGGARSCGWLCHPRGGCCVLLLLLLLGSGRRALGRVPVVRPLCLDGWVAIFVEGMRDGVLRRKSVEALVSSYRLAVTRASANVTLGVGGDEIEGGRGRVLFRLLLL